MQNTTAPGYTTLPRLHILSFLLSGLTYTIFYLISLRNTSRHHQPSLPAFSLALNISWELAITLTFPLTPLAASVYFSWLLVDIALVHNHVKYAGIRVWEVAGGVLLGGVGEWCALRTVVAVVVAGGGTREEGLFQGAFWTGYACQIVISAWSLWVVGRGAGKQLGYGQWLARFLGQFSIGLMSLDRARTFPEIYWYVTSPMGLFLIFAPIVLDLVWPVMRWMVVQDGEEGKSIEKKKM